MSFKSVLCYQRYSEWFSIKFTLLNERFLRFALNLDHTILNDHYGILIGFLASSSVRSSLWSKGQQLRVLLISLWMALVFKIALLFCGSIVLPAVGSLNLHIMSSSLLSLNRIFFKASINSLQGQSHILCVLASRVLVNKLYNYLPK